MIHFHVVTIHKDLFKSYLEGSMLGRGKKSGVLSYTFYDPRNFTRNRWRTLDGKPYGGGPGMVLEALPFLRAVEKAVGRKKKFTIILFSPSARKFTSKDAKELSRSNEHVILVCGHYEGIDARLRKMISDRYGKRVIKELSIGDYVLTGGELPALVVIDAISRYIPGVLGNLASLEEERVSSPDVYTRPEVIEYRKKRYRTPKVLLSGHHAKIDSWREKNRIIRTYGSKKK